MKPNTRVVVTSLNKFRGQTGTLIGTRRSVLLLGAPKRFPYIVRLDSGEVIYSAGVQRLKAKHDMAAR